jgi:hypothetical protein
VELTQFDFNTITDVIFHIRYTSREGGDLFKGMAVGALEKAINEMVVGEDRAGLFRLFSLRHDFPTEWSAFINGAGDFTATIRKDYFPYFTQGKKIKITGYDLFGQDVTKPRVVGNQNVWNAATADLGDTNKQAFPVTIAPDAPGPTQVLTRTADAQVFLIIHYSLS